MKRLIILLSCLTILIASPALGKNWTRGAVSGITGGVSGYLDSFDGLSLQNGDSAVYMSSNGLYVWYLNSTCNLTEAAPFVVSPDSNAGTKRWILIQDPAKYYVNYGAADQGDDADDYSLKDVLSTIGTSKEATVVFKHWPENGNTTTYTVSTTYDASAYTNVTFEIERGALLAPATTKTLTLPSPGHVDASPSQQWISGAGTVAFGAAGTIHPGWYGTPKNGSTDSTSYWTAINTSMVADSTIWLEPDANYYINTSGGITFSKKVHIKGFGALFTIGATVGNNPGITVSAAESTLQDFEINCALNHTDGGDDDFQDAGDVLGTNLRRGLKITGNHVTSKRIETTTAVVGIEYNATTGGEIKHCRLTNTTIKTTGSGTDSNAYHTGIYLNSATDCKVHNNYINGHGQCILQGNSSYRNKLYTNTCINASDNGIYISSGTDCEAFDNTIKSFDGAGIKVRDSYHNVHNNRVFGDNTDYSSTGISVTGNGADDGDGYNGRGTIVQANIIQGDFSYGIITDDQDSYHVKDVKILDNEIRFDSGPDGSVQGICILHQTVDAAGGDGIEICGNKITGHSLGILVNIHSSNTLDNFKIIGNHVLGGTDDNITVAYGRYGLIANNIASNAATNKSGLALTGCTYNLVSNNDFGDHQAIATQKYGIEEKTGSDFNSYINNYTKGNVTNEVVLVGTSSAGSFAERTEIVTGVVTITAYGTTLLNSNGGAVTATLGSGTFRGQRKVIGMNDASNASTVTVTAHETSSPEVFTFNAVTDYLVLEWMGSRWVTVANSGVAI